MTRFITTKLSLVAIAVSLGVPAAAQLKYENAGGGSVRLYGQLNPAFLSFDDGVSTTSEVVDNAHSNSRVGLWVIQPMNAGEFGFNFETALGLRASNGVSQTFTPKGVDWSRTNLRKIDFSLKTGNAGTFYIGQGSMASDGVAENDFSGTTLVTYASVGDTAGGFQFRTAAGALSGIAVGSVMSDLDGGRRGRIRYDTPSFGGFYLSAAIGKEVLVSGSNDKYGDIALKYSGDLANVKIKGAIGFSRRDRNGVDRDDTLGSISALWDSGLNVTIAAGRRKNSGSYGYAKLGYVGNWWSVGSTALSVDYYMGSDFNTAGSESTATGIGVVQKFDDANIEAYLGYRTYGLTETAMTYRDASSVLFGARWKF